MARKQWDELSPSYRARLERAGITRERHEQGAGLYRARGHTSSERESKQRSVRRWINRYAKDYGQDADEMKAFAAEDIDEMHAAMLMQKQLERDYHKGDLTKSSTFYRIRSRTLPDWMFFYHGVFK